MKKNNYTFSIAVDGSSASGKTTGSKIIAKKFRFKFLSSGKLYRYLALRIIKNKGKYKKLNSKQLYNPKITELSSIIAKKKYVRTSLRKFQSDFIKKNKKVLIEGRDIQSKIMPNADLKLFFKCSYKEKAKRRFKEFKKINKNVSLKEVEKALKLRDFSDKNRKESPLLLVKGAVLVDTTNLSIKQVEDKLTKLVKKAVNNKYGNL